MGKAGSLINRLLELYQQNASPEKLLVTAHMLLAELQHIQTPQEQSSTKKVIVILPSESLHIAADAFDTEDLKEQKSVSASPEIVSKQEDEMPVIGIENGNYDFNGFDPLRDIPTLAHQQKQNKELNESMAVNQKSLNEKLRTTNKEISSVLHEIPVKDLKKAIGINDRYLFISELFRGDEVMYERSIKTINSFSILPEAEYWIIRELKTKLGWNEKSETVQHFNQLVRRRFS